MTSVESVFKFRSWNQNDIDCVIASSIAASASVIAGHPPDSLKVRMQTASHRNQSIFRTTYTILKQEGIFSFYRGVIPPAIVKTFTTMTVFTVNNHLKDHIIARKHNQYISQKQPLPDKIVLSLSETFLVAAFCGFLISPFMSIGDLIKIQLQIDKNIATKPRVHNNMLHCIQTAIKYKQLHRGMMATSMRTTVGMGFYLLVYDAFNRYYDDEAVLGNNKTLSSWSVTTRVLISGTIAGFAFVASSYPFDYIQTQIQAHALHKNAPLIRNVIDITLRQYGVTGFYRGNIPCFLRSIPVNLVFFWVYESVLQQRKS